jgi:putative transposase
MRLRDDKDFQRHVDYIHYNPIKHGYVTRVADWQFSSFHHLVQLGIYPSDWAGEGLQDMDSVGME